MKDPFTELRGSTAAEMSVLRPMEKLPDLNRATVLVGAGSAPRPASGSPGRSTSAALALLRQRGAVGRIALDQSERRFASTNRRAGAFQFELGFPAFQGRGRAVPPWVAP